MKLDARMEERKGRICEDGEEKKDREEKKSRTQ